MENWHHFLVTVEERAVAAGIAADVVYAAASLPGVANYQDSSPGRTSNAYQRNDWVGVV